MPRIRQPKTDKSGDNDLEEAASTSRRLVYKRKRTDDEDISTIDDRAHSRTRDGHHSAVANDDSDDEAMDSINDSDSDEDSLHESGEGSDEDSDEDSPSDSEEDADEDSPPESDDDFDEDSSLESDEDSDEDVPFESDDDSEEEIPLSFGMNRREDGVTRFTSSRSRPSLVNYHQMQPLNRAMTQQRYQQQVTQNQQQVAQNQQQMTRNRQQVAQNNQQAAQNQQQMARNLLQRARHQLQQRQQQHQVIVSFNLGHNSTPRGLSESEISRLPSRKYIHPDSVSCRSSGSEVPHKRTKLNKECVVCLEDYKLGDVLRTLPCCHEFHTSCVDPWLKRKRTCPVCRFIVDLDVPTTSIGNN